MSEKEKDILEALRNKLLETSSVTIDDFFRENECGTPNCIYYLRRFENNLQECNNENHRRSYKEGKGRELDLNGKGVVPMAALKSSAALAWNIFGDKDSCHINSIWNHLSSGEYELKYEWESEAINNYDASIDAHLFMDSNHLFVEMKMLEPLTKSHPFKSINTYLESQKCPDEFKNAFRNFRDEEPEFFDAFQMIKHLLAIYNYFNKKKFESLQNVVLLNCHWKPSETYISRHHYSRRTISLQKTYDMFNETAKRFIDMEASFIPLLKSVGVNLKFDTCNHRELIALVGKSDNHYLKRYEI